MKHYIYGFFILPLLNKSEKIMSKGLHSRPKKKISAKTIIRFSFGIIMIAIYLGMGYLMLMNYFNIKHVISISLGVLFVVYGIFRGYRLAKGLDYNYANTDKDEEA